VHLEPNPFSGGESSAFTQNRIYPDSAFPECGDDPTTLLVNEGGPCPGYVPDGAPNDPTGPDGNGGFFFRRMVEFGPRGQDLTTESLNGLVGISGWFGDYNWQAGVAQNVVRIRGLSPTILSSVIDNEVSNNGLDLFERIPRDVVRRASHTQVETGVSRNRSLDGTLTGPAHFSLPGGDVRFAAHLDVVDEKYTDVFDAVSTNGDVFDGGSGGGGERALVALGGELSLPVFSMLEVAVAARYDQYYDDSDTGGALSPSAKIGYRPFDNLLVRASAGRSFRAPDLQRLFGATTAGFETVFDTPRCLDAGGQKGEPVNPNDPDDPCLEIQSVPVTVGPNPDLKEEEGTNLNFGVSWEILQDLNLTADYYEIKVDDLVNSLSAQQILDLCGEQGQFCDQIERDPDGTLGTPSAGGSNDALIRSTAFNIAKQEIHGYDVRLSYLFGLMNNWGQVRAELNWSHLTSVKVTAQPGARATQQLKSNDTVVMPQDRYNLTADWALDQLGATLRIDRVGRYPGGLASSPAEAHEFVEAFTTVGIQGRYDFGGPGMVRLGIDNLLDEEFSTDPTFQPGTPNVQNQYLGEGTSFYSNPLGRQFYAQYEISF
jgi:iron complex outermembrane recepter protein